VKPRNKTRLTHPKTWLTRAQKPGNNQPKWQIWIASQNPLKLKKKSEVGYAVRHALKGSEIEL
jgi:poly(3-hydroxyalkanoate) synthetase